MKLGLIGLPMSGKTTIFNALTGQDRPTTVAVPGQLDVQVATVDVPDPRLEQLVDLFDPKKTTYAKITYADIGGVSITESGLAGPFRTEISQMDGLLIVVRQFPSDSVPHPQERIDPARDLDALLTEFLLTDLVTVENRIERVSQELSKGKNRDANAREVALLERLRDALEAETPLRDLDLTEAEERELRGYAFLTMKPLLVVVNTGEERPEIEEMGGHRAIAIQGALEAEIAQLDEEEAEIFREEYGIDQPVRDRVIRESYQMLTINTFFTVGEDECRAWPFKAGSSAQRASGVIHSDLERGFIRAEIVEWETLVELESMAAARDAGKLRLEGRTYPVQDGDIMHVRHSA